METKTTAKTEREGSRLWILGEYVTKQDATQYLKEGNGVRHGNFYAEKVSGDVTEWSYMVFHVDGDAWWFDTAGEAIEVLDEMTVNQTGANYGDSLFGNMIECGNTLK